MTDETIKNCWRGTNILPVSLSAEIRMDEEVPANLDDTVVDEMTELFNAKFNTDFKWEKEDVVHYLDSEAGEITEKEETEGDIVTRVLQENGVEPASVTVEDDEEEDVEEISMVHSRKVLSCSEALQHLDDLIHFFEKVPTWQGEDRSEWLLSLYTKKEDIEKHDAKMKRQSTMLDFFPSSSSNS